MKINRLHIWIVAEIIVTVLFIVFFYLPLQKENNQLVTDNEHLKIEIDARNLNGGFFGWPPGTPDKSYFFLVLASVRGTALEPEEKNTAYHVVYDLESKKYVAMKSTENALAGRDFIVGCEYDNGPVTRFYTQEKAAEILERFGVKIGSAR